VSGKVLNPFLSNLRGEQRAKSVPSEPYRLVADVDPALMQKVLHISKGKWKPDVHDHSKTDDFRAGLGIPK